MQTDLIFPATWCVIGFVGLWVIIFGVAYFYVRRHGQFGDMEQIKFKVFDDGIPNPQPGDGQRPERPTR